MTSPAIEAPTGVGDKPARDYDVASPGGLRTLILEAAIRLCGLRKQKATGTNVGAAIWAVLMDVRKKLPDAPVINSTHSLYECEDVAVLGAYAEALGDSFARNAAVSDEATLKESDEAAREYFRAEGA